MSDCNIVSIAWLLLLTTAFNLPLLLAMLARARRDREGGGSSSINMSLRLCWCALSDSYDDGAAVVSGAGVLRLVLK